ncbi:citrate/2-methylcitrate synthase [Asanoa siamensis]|uniref:citrate synthase (unknown stereospecificity) n=1 Tax=Asanoa siamensis TaxID=926357 RepID=A0ABQ4CLA0_9ACTN|nr:citrate/2-methylcitrate synthase [Asanoa siamensis]GIF72057.1 hypothetical protein Asi02nite_15750 [Asanoa siamensis]
MEQLTGWLTAAEAAERLGVKPATLYAYVSRGVLARRRSPAGQSLFDPAEVERLARRGRPRRPAGASEVVIESRITALGGDRPFYRGRDALELAASASFEEVAVGLWTGSFDATAQRGVDGDSLESRDVPTTHTAGQTDAASRESVGAPTLQTIGHADAASPKSSNASTPHTVGHADAAPPQSPDAPNPQTVGHAHAVPPQSSDARTPQIVGHAHAGPPESPDAPTAQTADAASVEWQAGTVLQGDGGDLAEWRAGAASLAAGRAASAALPADVLLLDRILAIVPALAAADPLRGNLDPAAVVDVGRAVIAGVVDCLPERGPAASGSIAARLAARLGAENRFIDSIRAALVLLADHELAASTLAARVAASVRADPYAVVVTGLATVSGALHGGASLGAEALLDAVSDPAEADAAIGLRLRRGERIPGFGHAVYKAGDGRAGALLDRISAAAPDHPVLASAAALREAARRRRLPEPNVDFALATLTRAAGLPTGAGEAIFAVARIAGWLAHAMEEYEQRTPLRLRAVYVGP